MNYLAYWFFSKMPCCLEQKMIIDGKEEVCLVLPVKANQIKKGKHGNWIMMCRLAECEPNERMQTHDIQLSYLSEEDLQKSYDFGYHKRTAHMGRVYEHDRTPSKKIDRTNRAHDIDLRGNICLSDIPRDLIFANAENAKKYISNLTFKGLHDENFIYTGCICLSDIPKEDRWQDPNTGKKYVSVRLIKLKSLDTYMNTHQLIIARQDGTEIEIGKFKEFQKTNYIPPQNIQYPAPLNMNDNPKDLPSEINGIKF